MRGRMAKSFWKRFTAIFLSVVLIAGISEGPGASLVKAEELFWVRCQLTVEGYEGDGEPEFGEVFLRLSDNRDDRNSYIDIEPERVEINKEGENFVYNYYFYFERGKYWSAEWKCRCNGREMYLNNCMQSSGTFGDQSSDTGIALGDTIYRVRFVDEERVHYEQYCHHWYYSSLFYDPTDVPVREQHTFLGWRKENSQTIITMNDRFFDQHISAPQTYYAVWEHPAEDAWDWKHDESTHWKECSCGELKTAAEVHEWDEGTVTKQPGVGREGEKTYTCMDCGAVRTEILPAEKGDTPSVSGNDSVSENDPGQSGGTDTPGNTDAPGGTDNPGNTDVTGGANIPDNTNSPDNSGLPGNGNVSQTGNATGDNSSVVPAGTGQASRGNGKEPKTGDTFYIEIYATAAMIAGMAYLLLYFNDDECGMPEEKKKKAVERLINWAKRGGYFRRLAAVVMIFGILVYYHGIGKRIGAGHRIVA